MNLDYLHENKNTLDMKRSPSPPPKIVPVHKLQILPLTLKIIDAPQT